MGNRFLRDAILRSDRICEASDAAQLLFYKLLSVVDDYGCYDGRERIVALGAYPLTARDVTKELRELQERGAIVRYLNAGKPYIAVMQWGEITRNSRRKFPAPPVMNDLPDLKYRSPWNNLADGWHNPKGAEPVSTLLDINGRPVVPQPPEWRRVDSDHMPIGAAAQNEEGAKQRERAKSTRKATQHITRNSDAAQDVQHGRSTSHAASGLHSLGNRNAAHDVHAASIPLLPIPILPVAVGAAEAAPPPVQRDVQHQRSTPENPPTPTPTNGEIKLLDNGEWHGLSEAQRLRWQEMFADMSIPDQLDRAGAWLLANPDDRAAYARGERGGHEGYLIRWLLREARGPAEVKPR